MARRPRPEGQSIKLRERLISKAVLLIGDLADHAYQQTFYDQIVEAVVEAADPDTQLKIIRALDSLNSRDLAAPPSAANS